MLGLPEVAKPTLSQMSGTSATSHMIPIPIGGVPIHVDLAPSILFAVLYATLTALGIYRLSQPASRSLVIVGTVISVLER